MKQRLAAWRAENNRIEGNVDLSLTLHRSIYIVCSRLASLASNAQQTLPCLYLRTTYCATRSSFCKAWTASTSHSSTRQFRDRSRARESCRCTLWTWILIRMLDRRADLPSPNRQERCA